MRITIMNMKDHTREEFGNVLALLTSPGTNSISFCVANKDGTISEVKRYDLTAWEMLITSV